ncbi:unnamed protein product [Thlaspi arvense]|uniref:DUF7792 domain-containing protein n=1 Tax=Thlaspi arvense TaxID=13288 RepID=A0AAU9S6Z7_THLAR|nr:unnamed protein product [Thlaspi arvense]
MTFGKFRRTQEQPPLIFSDLNWVSPDFTGEHPAVPAAMADKVKQILARPIQLADQVVKAADEASSSKSECLELKMKTEKLAGLLRQAARASNDLYERPTKRIIEETEKVLERALVLSTWRREASFHSQPHGGLPQDGDTGGELRRRRVVVASSLGAGRRPRRRRRVLWMIDLTLLLLWFSLARDNDRYGKLIIEEGGVAPLLKLVKEGKLEGQENAARAIGFLCRDPESVECMLDAGVCQVFAKMLKEGPMKVQAVVAWAVSELVSHYPKCQDLFAQHNVIRLLVGHLAFGTVQEHSKYAIPSKSLHAVVVASNNSNACTSNENEDDDSQNLPPIPRPFSRNNEQGSQMHSVVTSTMAMNAQSKLKQSNGGNQTTELAHHAKTNSVSNSSYHLYSSHGTGIKGRELEDPETKACMKAMAARAFGTSPRETRPFAGASLILLEKGPEQVRYNSAMALMEITAVAEEDTDLRRSAFKPNSPACKAVVDQLHIIIDKADSELLIPCIRSVGNLARTFRATETRMISPLVRLLDDREAEVSVEACVALGKFACIENYLRLDHSKAIISAGGAKHLIQLAYFGEQIVQKPALILLCYIAKNVPDSEELAEAKVLTVLEWASKQAHFMQDDKVEPLLQDARSKLELYQSGISRGFH